MGQIMKRALNRRELRREYVRNKIFVHLKLALVSAFAVLGLAATIGAIGIALYVQRHARALDMSLDAPEAIAEMLGIIGIIAGLFTVMCGRMVPRAYKEIQIPYVQPVSAATLPAQEVLVRGSVEPPVVQNGALLRAATEASTPTEELLRTIDHAG